MTYLLHVLIMLSESEFEELDMGLLDVDMAAAIEQDGSVPSIHAFHLSICSFLARQPPEGSVSATTLRQNASSIDPVKGYWNRACFSSYSARFSVVF